MPNVGAPDRSASTRDRGASESLEPADHRAGQMVGPRPTRPASRPRRVASRADPRARRPCPATRRAAPVRGGAPGEVPARTGRIRVPARAARLRVVPRCVEGGVALEIGFSTHPGALGVSVAIGWHQGRCERFQRSCYDATAVQRPSWRSSNSIDTRAQLTPHQRVPTPLSYNAKTEHLATIDCDVLFEGADVVFEAERPARASKTRKREFCRALRAGASGGAHLFL